MVPHGSTKTIARSVDASITDENRRIARGAVTQRMLVGACLGLAWGAALLTLAAGIGLFLGKGASETFGALYFLLLMALLAIGVSAPFRSASRPKNTA